MQGGIGGGSSNAAATLFGLERVLRSELAPGERLRLAAEVGSYLPLFLLGGTVLGAEIAARFRYPAYAQLDDSPPELAAARRADRRFDAWVDNAVANHKVPGYAIVTLSLKPEGGTPGDLTAEQMDAIADLAERYSFDEIRVGHEQNLALPHVAQRDLPALWRELDAIGVATPNVNLITDIISCPGLDYCSLANARSIPIAQEITRRFRNPELTRDLGRLHINISGCINACGHHHVGHIGILGVEKNGEEFYQITLGGKADENATLGALMGPAVPYAQVADVVEDIAAAYVELRQRPEELFIETVKRVGVEPFRERVYADSLKSARSSRIATSACSTTRRYRRECRSS